MKLEDRNAVRLISLFLKFGVKSVTFTKELSNSINNIFLASQPNATCICICIVFAEVDL